MPSRVAVVVAVLFLTVALICSFSASRLEAVPQPTQGGGYPNYEPTTGATPDCLVTPKKYLNYGGEYGLKTYSELQCCKTSYSGPNLSRQIVTCANYYEWKECCATQTDQVVYGYPKEAVTSWGYLPPGHAYLKSSGPPLQPPTSVGPPVVGIFKLPPGTTSVPRILGNNTGNTTNPGNTISLPPGSIFKVPPGTTKSQPTGNNTGTFPPLTIIKEHNPASPNVLSLAGNSTGPSNNASNPKLIPLTNQQQQLSAHHHHKGSNVAGNNQTNSIQGHSHVTIQNNG